jgi:dipeptidyl aminopeptidase/acylaminoacyl peptidase
VAAVDYVGVSNLFTFLESMPPYWKPMLDMLYEMIGDPRTEEGKQALHDASPLFFVDRIVTPLLVAQGANDPRVKQAESDQIVDALRARGVDVKYILKENEGHGFHNEENMFEFYEAMDTFLAEYLGGAAKK